jgi:hypothetical protein
MRLTLLAWIVCTSSLAYCQSTAPGPAAPADTAHNRPTLRYLGTCPAAATSPITPDVTKAFEGGQGLPTSRNWVIPQLNAKELSLPSPNMDPRLDTINGPHQPSFTSGSPCSLIAQNLEPYPLHSPGTFHGRSEPIPTQWPLAKFEQIPMEWPGLKMALIEHQPANPTAPSK